MGKRKYITNQPPKPSQEIQSVNYGYSLISIIIIMASMIFSTVIIFLLITGSI